MWNVYLWEGLLGSDVFKFLARIFADYYED